MSEFQSIYHTAIKDKNLLYDAEQVALLDQFSAVSVDLRKMDRRQFWPWQKKYPPRGIYLWGSVGRGKSMLMDLFFQTAPVRKKQRLHFHEFMQDIHRRIDTVRKTYARDAIRPVSEALSKEIRLLCLDEMQITDIADAMIVGRLFKILLKNKVVIVTTSNRAPDDLYKDGLNREHFLPFIDMLKENLQILNLKGGEDYRTKQLQAVECYLCPLSPETEAKIDSIWAGLCPSTESRLDLRLKGRSLTIPRYANGVGRMSFNALCAKACGAEDFIALTNALRVLILENIPILAPKNANEAKRFITFIDIAYEARLNLICSAEVAPEKLYQFGKESFEFQRTASRLREMQSFNWGELKRNRSHI